MPKVFIKNECSWNIAFNVQSDDGILVEGRFKSQFGEKGLLLGPNEVFEVPIDYLIDNDEVWVEVFSEKRFTAFLLTEIFKQKPIFEKNYFQIRNNGIYLNNILQELFILFTLAI